MRLWKQEATSKLWPRMRTSTVALADRQMMRWPSVSGAVDSTSMVLEGGKWWFITTASWWGEDTATRGLPRAAMSAGGVGAPVSAGPGA